MEGCLPLVGIVLVGFVIYLIAQSSSTPEEKEAQLHGGVNPHMICPHCQTQGQVRTKAITQKKGVSGGKATAALLTGGVSLLATGLSRSEGATQAYCGRCLNTWIL